MFVTAFAHFGLECNQFGQPQSTKYDVVDGNYPYLCFTQAIYITTYRIVERGYGKSGRKFGTTRVVGGERNWESLKTSVVGGPVGEWRKPHEWWRMELAFE
ncbi:hypothetical protein TIFTF001_035933 [Ficus carica]|uniref:Uncharacterized protein n=1 Tax=Ficus carica TaxID=3494 RepID=A0AA88JC95_FICCA|nr:hypothetical protein TIFTF001_035933 [Ficus carica]